MYKNLHIINIKPMSLKFGRGICCPAVHKAATFDFGIRQNNFRFDYLFPT